MKANCKRDGTIFEAEVRVPKSEVADRPATEYEMHERAYAEAIPLMKQWLIPQLFDNGSELILRLRFSSLNIGPDPKHAEKRITTYLKPPQRKDHDTSATYTPAIDQERIF